MQPPVRLFGSGAGSDCAPATITGMRSCDDTLGTIQDRKERATPIARMGCRTPASAVAAMARAGQAWGWASLAPNILAPPPAPAHQVASVPSRTPRHAPALHLAAQPAADCTGCAPPGAGRLRAGRAAGRGAAPVALCPGVHRRSRRHRAVRRAGRVDQRVAAGVHDGPAGGDAVRLPVACLGRAVLHRRRRRRPRAGPAVPAGVGVAGPVPERGHRPGPCAGR